jgi:hypothetical protein
MARRAKKAVATPASVRTRAIVAVVALIVFWPLVQRVLVATHDVNPWRLAGFAMYATPTPPVLVVAFEPRGEGGIPIDHRGLSASTQQAFGRFEQERHALGDFRRPDEVAAAVLRARPELSEVVILVQRMVLDPGTARMRSRTMHYTYDRSGLVGERPVPPSA